MFADTLRAAREDAHVSVARLAELAGTSRAAITEYESGRKAPRTDTADRILGALGRVNIAVPMTPSQPTRIDDNVLEPLFQWAPDRDRILAQARRDQAVIVEADAAIERLEVTWGQVKTVVDGVTVEGDELSIWRLWELRNSLLDTLHSIELGHEPRLSVIASRGLVTANESLDVPRRALDFMTRAIRAGADPAAMRHLAGAYLAHHGYPWLYIPFKLASEYRRALVAVRRNGDGTTMAGLLIESMKRMEQE